MTTENLSFYIPFAANGNPTGFVTVTSSPSRMGATLFCPRHYRLKLRALHGWILLAESLNTAAVSMAMVLKRLAQNQLPEEVDDMIKNVLWAWGANHTIIGIPANQSQDRNGTVIEVDLSDRRGNEMTTSPQNNLINSFGFIGIGDGNMNLRGNMVIEYDLEWLGGEGENHERDIVNINFSMET